LKGDGSREMKIFHEVSGQVRSTYSLAEHLPDLFRSQIGRMIFSPLEWDLTSIIDKADSGMGMEEEIAKTLFHEVQQASAAGTEGETGSGAGLYLCEKFVSLHGGRIWYESIRGRGSPFFFKIPANGEAIDSRGNAG
jgi:signal transduction histidine kinase